MNSITPNYKNNMSSISHSTKNATQSPFQTQIDFEQLDQKLRSCTLEIEPITFTKKSPTDYLKALNDWVLDTREGTSQESKYDVEERILHCIKNNKKTLILSDLKLRSIPPLFGLSHITALSLRNNKIKQIPQFRFTELQELKVLDLESNELTTLNGLDLKKCTELKTLFLKKNQLTTFNYSKNNIPTFHFSLPPNIRTITLENNHLHEIDLIECSNLKILDLSMNHMKDFRKLKLPTSISTLNLSENEWENITKENLPNLPNLTSLNLSRCQIKHLIINFDKYPKLKILNLSHNQLHNIEHLNLTFNSELVTLFLHRNQIRRLNCQLPSIQNPKFHIYSHANLIETNLRYRRNLETPILTEPLDPLGLNPEETDEIPINLFETLAKWQQSPYHPLWKHLSNKSFTKKQPIYLIILLEQLYEQSSNENPSLKTMHQNSVKQFLRNLEDLYPCHNLLEECNRLANHHILSSTLELGINGLLTLSKLVIKERQNNISDNEISLKTHILMTMHLNIPPQLSFDLVEW